MFGTKADPNEAGGKSAEIWKSLNQLQLPGRSEWVGLSQNAADNSKVMEKMHNEDPKKWGRETKPKWDSVPDS
jgi:hypothetical protein